ncbi:hypothetical protein BSLG_009834 [Batrachochytrium salamandrivorans]|nr:hypothetical protein BSLG_009834 [Batrachochytrium salamandrivorans]
MDTATNYMFTTDLLKMYSVWQLAAVTAVILAITHVTYTLLWSKSSLAISKGLQLVPVAQEGLPIVGTANAFRDNPRGFLSKYESKLGKVFSVDMVAMRINFFLAPSYQISFFKLTRDGDFRLEDAFTACADPPTVDLVEFSSSMTIRIVVMALQRLDSTCGTFVSWVEDEIRLRIDGKETHHKDYLQQFLNGEAFQKYPKEIPLHVVAMILAAHTNTAGTMFWTLYEIAKSQTLQQRVYDELDSFGIRRLLKFDPDRFLGDKHSNSALTGEYVQFGQGAHKCRGEKFILYSLVNAVIPTILSHTKLSVVLQGPDDTRDCDYFSTVGVPFSDKPITIRLDKL